MLVAVVEVEEDSGKIHSAAVCLSAWIPRGELPPSSPRHQATPSLPFFPEPEPKPKTMASQQVRFHSSSATTATRGAKQQQQHRRRSQRSNVRTQASAPNTFGNLFRVTTFGESHGGGVGCVIDGCPPRVPISVDDMQFELDRRRPGQSRITTPRKETDTAEILSGIGDDGRTLGTPIAVLVRNKDHRPQDYSEISVAYRPSHADFTYDLKFGTRAIAGGGRSSARETIGRVAAGAVAKKVLREVCGTEVLAYVSQVREVKVPFGAVDHSTLTLDDIEANMVRCPDASLAEDMIAVIDDVRTRGESCGGVVTCVVQNCPPGIGAPVFDRLDADLAKACMSLPATKGFEMGLGFDAVAMTGSEHNDLIYTDDATNEIRTRTNNAGGILGGIANGELIEMRVAFKPTSTIMKEQESITREKVSTTLKARGRHDACVVPRAVPMVESMVALVLLDHVLMHYAQTSLVLDPEQISSAAIRPTEFAYEKPNSSSGPPRSEATSVLRGVEED